MKYILVIALKNILRHKNRNLMIGAGIAFSVGMLFFILSLALGIEEQLVLNLINMESGAVTITPSSGLLISDDTERYKDEIDASVKRINSLPDVVSVRDRVHIISFLYFENDSERINLKGIDPSKEQALLSGFNFSTDSVGPLSKGGIFISQVLANKLNIRKGDMCNVMAQTIHNTLNLYDFIVAGIYTNVSGWDNSIVYAHIDNVKSLANTTIPTSMLVDIRSLNKVGDLKKDIKQAFTSTVIDSMEVKSYDENLGVTHVVANANRYSFLSIVIFIQLMSFIAIVFLVLNNLMERTNEVGTLLAIGFKPFYVKIIFMAESFVIGLISSIAGIVFFLLVVLILSVNGVNIGESAAIVFGNSTVRPVFSLDNMMISLTVGIIYPLLSSFFGTLRVNRIEPIEALRVRVV